MSPGGGPRQNALQSYLTKHWTDQMIFSPAPVLPGLYLLKGKTSYRQISWSLEAARLNAQMNVLL